MHSHRPSLALTAICLGFLMITLDATIVNVALGPIGADLGSSLSAAQWIVNGYTLAFAALLLSAGALADRIGARRGYLIGLAIFAAGSALCAAATSMPVLIGARVIQGTGAAWLMPCSLALIAHSFPEGAARRRALAVWGGASGVGLASGPILGGLLTSAVGWPAIFLVNLPVALIAAVLLVGQVDETRRHEHRLDIPGQALSVLWQTLVVAGFIVAGQGGWSSPAALALIGAGVVAAGVFVIGERAVAHPMVDPRLFHRRTFSVAVAVGLLFNFTLYGGLFCLALDLRDAHGLGALSTGLAMLPMTAAVGVTAFLSGRAVARYGEWPVMITGLGVGVVGAALVAANAAGGPVWLLVASSLPLGLTSLAMPAMTAVAMADTPADRVGLASGVLNAARQTGGALGVAALGALVGAGGGAQLHAAFAAIAAVYGLGVLIALAGRQAAATAMPAAMATSR